MMTEEQIIARLQAARLDRPRQPLPKPSASARASETFRASRKPIRAVIADALAHNTALTARLEEECRVLDQVADRARLYRVIGAARYLAQAIEELDEIESPIWSLSEAKRDAIQRQVLAVLKVKG
jgi:hypothetical protein